MMLCNRGQFFFLTSLIGIFFFDGIAIAMKRTIAECTQDAQDISDKIAKVRRSTDIGFVQEIQSIIRSGDVNNREPFSPSPVIFRLLDEPEYAPVVEYIIDHGADPNIQNGFRKRPLLHAVEQGNSLGVRALLVKGALVSACNTPYETLLGVAVRNADVPVIKALLENGINPNEVDDRGNSPLFKVVKRSFGGWDSRYRIAGCSYEELKEIVSILLYHGALRHYDYQGVTKNVVRQARAAGFYGLANHMFKSKKRLQDSLTELLSRGQTPFPYTVARLIAEYKYANDALTVPVVAGS